ERSVPRGLTWAVLTTVVLVLLTLVLGCGALEAGRLVKRGDSYISYPLVEVLHSLPGVPTWLLYGFGVVALSGLVASYHGLLYGASRQLLALGQQGYLPAWLGGVHATRQTPVAALLVCSAFCAAFVVVNLWYVPAVKLAVLVAGFSALVLYIASMA